MCVRLLRNNRLNSVASSLRLPENFRPQKRLAGWLKFSERLLERKMDSWKRREIFRENQKLLAVDTSLNGCRVLCCVVLAMLAGRQH